MSDFIFSRDKIDEYKITKAIQSIYDYDKPRVFEFHGEWGSLGVSENLYNGFNPFENEEYIVIVIGGPILTFRNNSFISECNSNKGTILIFQRWIRNEIKWDDDLSGPFAIFIINKFTGKAICVTDLMSFIPVYKFGTSKSIRLSTHVDLLAKFSGQLDNIDKISEIDFILHGIVTYPYTFYNDIIQISPASEHRIKNNSSELISTNYWIPIEKSINISINKVANELRGYLLEYVNNIIAESDNIAQFISGGEDSRTLSALLQENKRDAFIFLDHMNREGETAEKVAHIYGANFKLYTRSSLHYLNILPACSNLVGSGSQYHHAHTYGFHEKSKLNSYSAVFGGLFSDALLKGARIKRIRRTGKIPLIPEMKCNKGSALNSIINPIFNTNALMKLTKRRRNHLKYIQSFRKESAEEWFELWPSSMNRNIPNLHANRRLFRSYEPFMSKDVVKMSAYVPQKWKLNRKLFHRMAKPLLKPTKWLQHADGWYPYYSWYFKSIVYPMVRAYRKVEQNVGVNKGNQGPWGQWNTVVSSDLWLKKLKKYSIGLEELHLVLNNKNIFKLINSGELTVAQQVNLLQVMYINSRK